MTSGCGIATVNGWLGVGEGEEEKEEKVYSSDLRGRTRGCLS